MSPSGEALTVSVTAAAGCEWTSSSSADWIGITAGRSGSGTGSVQVVVDRNSGAARTGAVTVAGQKVTLEQAPAPAPTCGYSIKPTYYDAGRGPDDISVKVTAGNGCAWAVTGGAAWVTVAEGRSGAGNGTVRLLVEANSGPGRTASLTIAGEAFTLTQTGCPARIKPTHYEAGRGPDDIRIRVTAAAGCSWVTTSSASWVTVDEGSSGAGDGTVRLLVEANSSAARATTLTVAGETFTLRQEGPR